jgi:hypothetical protein
MRDDPMDNCDKRLAVRGQCNRAAVFGKDFSAPGAADQEISRRWRL